MPQLAHHRSVLLVLLLALALVPSAGAENPAGPVDPQQIEQMTADFEMLFNELHDAQPAGPVFRDHGNGLHSMTIPLPPEVASRLAGTEENSLATLQALAAGLQLSDPSSVSSLIHAALSDTRFDYNYWWAVANITSSDISKTTKATLTGPGNKFNETFNTVYDALSVVVYWYNPGFGVDRAGTYTFKAKVTGGGTAKVKTRAD